MTKRCGACGKAKPFDEFYRRQGGKYLTAACKDCTKAKRKKWAEENPERDRKIKREANRRYREKHPERDAERYRRWEENNPDRVADRNAQRREAQRTRLRNFKLHLLDLAGVRSCECGEDHPACLDFHHKDPSQKSFQLCTFASSKRSDEELLAELAKCEVLCANCHRKHHFRGGDSNH